MARARMDVETSRGGIIFPYPLARRILKSMTRRQLLSLPLGAVALGPSGRAQQYGGMASRGVKATARGKPSGLPFNAHFVNVAQPAGQIGRAHV